MKYRRLLFPYSYTPQHPRDTPGGATRVTTMEQRLTTISAPCTPLNRQKKDRTPPIVSPKKEIAPPPAFGSGQRLARRVAPRSPSAAHLEAQRRVQANAALLPTRSLAPSLGTDPSRSSASRRQTQESATCHFATSLPNVSIPAPSATRWAN